MIGVYIITNKLNGRQYVGQSNNIQRRFKEHCGYANRRTPVTDDIKKYGVENFTLEVIHPFETVDRETMIALEMYEIRSRQTTDPVKGYNQIEGHMNGDDNPNYGNYWSEDAKRRMGNIKSQQHRNGEIYGGEWKSKIGEKSEKFWKENPDVKAQMAQKVKKKKQEKYKFIQMTREGEVIREWDTVEEILEANPTWKWQNIYSVCNGYKPTIYGYKWRKELKNHEN